MTLIVIKILSGLETVKALALTGCKVYMACRSKDSGKDVR